MKNADLSPAMGMSLKMQGQFRCVLNEGTEREKDSGWFDNLITDGGLDRVAGARNALDYCSIGTGTAAPAYTDTRLASYVASTTKLGRVVTNAGPPSYACSEVNGYTFAQGSVVGNMAEVGIGWTNTGIGLWSRARILNDSGEPTTLTVTAIDQLTVYYKLTSYAPLADLVGVVNLSGTDYAYTARLASADSFDPGLSMFSWEAYGVRSIANYLSSATLGPITGNVIGGSVSYEGPAYANSSYAPGQRYLDTIATWGPSIGNRAGGIGALSLTFSGYAKFQYKFTTPIPKDNTKTLTLTFRAAWDRI